MQFGETLRKAREAKGLSHSQVAEETHMLVQIVQDMENEDFRRIPAAVYGRGFVRLFAECVGLDPRPLLLEFNSLYGASKDAPAAAHAAPPPARQPAPEKEFRFGGPAEPPAAGDGPAQQDLPPAPPRGTAGLELFDPPAPANVQPPPAAEPRRPDPGASRFAPPEDDEAYDERTFQEKLSDAARRFRSGVSALAGNISRRTKRIPRRTRRTILVAAAALAAVALCVKACSAIRSSLSEPGKPENQGAGAAQEPAKARTPAGGSYIPTDLYKD